MILASGLSTGAGLWLAIFVLVGVAHHYDRKEDDDG